MGFADKKWIASYTTVLGSYVDEDGNEVETRLDDQTGEIVDYVISKQQSRNIAYPAPIEIAVLNSREIFLSTVKQSIGKRRYSLWVGEVLLDMVVDLKLHPSVFTVFCYLGRSLSYNHMVYTTTEELIKGTGYNRNTVGRAIKSLSELGMLRDAGVKLVGKSDKFFLLNPRYFFFGYYPYRQVLVRDWYKAG